MFACCLPSQRLYFEFCKSALGIRCLKKEHFEWRPLKHDNILHDDAKHFNIKEFTALVPKWCERFCGNLIGKTGESYSQSLRELLRVWGETVVSASDLFRSVACMSTMIEPPQLFVFGSSWLASPSAKPRTPQIMCFSFG